MAAPSDPTDLESQLALETLISDISARLVAAPDETLASTIETALGETARFFRADLSQLLLVHAPQSEVRVLHAWCADTVESRDCGVPASSFAEHMPWTADLVVAKRQPLVMSALAELPPEAQQDRSSFTARGVRSAVWVPIAIGPDLQYLLSIEATGGAVHWPHWFVPRLVRLGEIFGHVVERKRVTDALRETDARTTLAEAEHRANVAHLEASVEAAGLGFYVMSPPGETALLDDRARALFGIPPNQESRTRTFWLEHVHPDDRDRVIEASREVHAGDVDRVSRVYRYLHPTRGLVWLHHTTRTFERDASGRPARVAGVLQDVTDQKRAESELREREARLAAAAELAGLGFYDLDYGKGLAFVDDRFRELCGIPSGQLEGLEVVEFWRAHLHPDDRPRIEEILQKGHAGKLDRVTLEYRFLHPARGERWFQHVATVVSRDFGVSRVAFVLTVNLARHALEGFHDLRFGTNTMMQPVRNVLAGNTQRGAIFHQADVVDVRHFGTADALIDPAHDVAENALRVVVQFLLDFFSTPVRVSSNGMVRMSSILARGRLFSSS